MTQQLPISVAIPTLNRGEIVLETIEMLLEQTPPAGEILIVDQTEEHPLHIDEKLSHLNEAHQIRWIRLPVPSITGAMNAALRESRFPVILYLDDDIIPGESLIENHARMYKDSSVDSVVGQVLQPGETPEHIDDYDRGNGLTRDLAFPFRSTEVSDVWNVMAGNLSVRVDVAMEIGGFDENFQFVAYRFETDFACRLRKNGKRIVFQPDASIRHLRIRTGGTRTRANHLTSPRPDHSLGDYYYALKHGTPLQSVLYIGRRFCFATATKFHFTHPWYIPVVLLGEIRGLFGAMRCWLRGNKVQRTDDFVGHGKEARAEFTTEPPLTTTEPDDLSRVDA